MVDITGSQLEARSIRVRVSYLRLREVDEAKGKTKLYGVY